MIAIIERYPHNTGTRTCLALLSSINSRHPISANNVMSISYVKPPSVMAPNAIINPITAVITRVLSIDYSSCKPPKRRSRF